MNQWIGLAISYAFVFAVLGVAGVLQKRGRISGETARKIVHIGVSNWIVLAMFLFHDWYFAIIGPASFVILNFISWRYDLFEGMEAGDKSPGTVFFAISLTVVTWHFWWLWNTTGVDLRFIAVTAILVMGWGDGLAAVFGHRYGKRKLIGYKTLVGTTAMFIVSVIVCLAVSLLLAPWPAATALLLGLALAALATIGELLLPAGWDNLIVPLVTAYAYYGWIVLAPGF
ncbi:MAG: phosphatidate cytidylyltransferase [Candidatus Coatesbacteria bacterium]|nr:phosphatidate cytidylyltransferase [Candidatus Coatesbacteria bacterium]